MEQLDLFPNVSVSVEYITPKIAESYLACSRGNRNISHLVVEKYARMMRDGQWGESSDCISFDRDGVLINGHQRLLAVVRSGCAIRALVSRGHKHDAMLTIDTGRVRTSANTIEFALPNVKNSTKLATVARYLLCYDRVLGFSLPKMALVSNADIAQFVVDNYEKIVFRHWDFLDGLRSQIAIFRFLAVEKYPPEKVDLFLEKLNSGANLDRDDPIMALRTAIINWRSHFRFRSSQSDTVFRLACIFKAFNYWISGRKCRLIKIISGEAFPVIK